ncbi:MAG TPA: hypothetical protein VGT08_11955 [Terracidiphilus sp.]|nr:hypothetical protein [Terracidiphilus sp.]
MLQFYATTRRKDCDTKVEWRFSIRATCPSHPPARAESLTSETVNRAIRIAEDQLYPVLAMLRPGTQIISSWQMD